MAIVRPVHGPQRTGADLMAFPKLIRGAVDHYLEESGTDPNAFAETLAKAGVVLAEVDAYTRLGELTRLIHVLSELGVKFTLAIEPSSTTET